MDEGPHDLVIRAGRVVCPSTGLDGPGAVAIRGDRIAASPVEPELIPAGDLAAAETLDFPDGLLLPGLIDLHAHPALEGSRFGINPDEHMLPRGTTTVLSQGDAGASNWPRYRERVIRGLWTRVRLAINLAAPGESGTGGCLVNLNDADVGACVRAIENGGPDIWGVAVNLSRAACGENDPREIMRRALSVAERTERPLLLGTRQGHDWSLPEQMMLLRPGDVVTYCFHGRDQPIVQDGRVLPCVWEARERGVLFDIGHGMASFDFDVAETAITDGFLPDTISTDKYRRHLDAVPPHDLPLTISKLLAAGLAEADVWPRVTQRPAELLGLAGEIGTLAPGSCADLAILRWSDEPGELVDCAGKTRTAGRWEPVLTVRGGEIFRPATA